MKVALGQISSSASPEENLDVIEKTIIRACKNNAELIVFPEAAICRFGVPLYPIAQRYGNNWSEKIQYFSNQYHIAIVAGIFTPAKNNKVKNTLIFARPEQKLAHYHKIHCYDAFGFTESTHVRSGKHYTLVRYHDVTYGITTCYDLRFPHIFTALARAGAQVIILGASWGDGDDKLRQWQLLVQARALDSASFILACDQAKPAESAINPDKAAPLGIGHSMICAPDGKILAKAGAKPQVLYHDIDPTCVGYYREKLGVLSNSRTGAIRYYD